MSLGGLDLVEALSLDLTDLRRVSLVVFMMRLVAANLRVFLALPMSSKGSSTSNKKKRAFFGGKFRKCK